MADVHSKDIRSFNMSRIKSKNTRPEIIVRKSLFKSGFRFRLHNKSLAGKPDIVLKKYKTVIFVHGCFWHGHENCRLFVLPKTRSEWWKEKIERNKQLDMENRIELEKNGWNVLEIYECGLKKDIFNSTLSDLFNQIRRTN